MLMCSLTSVLLPQLAYYVKGNSGGPLLFYHYYSLPPLHHLLVA